MRKSYRVVKSTEEFRLRLTRVCISLHDSFLDTSPLSYRDVLFDNHALRFPPRHDANRGASWCRHCHSRELGRGTGSQIETAILWPPSDENLCNGRCRWFASLAKNSSRFARIVFAAGLFRRENVRRAEPARFINVSIRNHVV